MIRDKNRPPMGARDTTTKQLPAHLVGATWSGRTVELVTREKPLDLIAKMTVFRGEADKYKRRP